MDQADLEQLQAKLPEHKEQLAQIEELLKANPNDETLLKLHADLKQVIALTEDLTKMQGKHAHALLSFCFFPLPKQSSLSSPRSCVSLPGIPTLPQEERKWKVDDRCMALWEDGQYYVARIDSVDDVGGYTITYLEYGQQV